MDEVNGRRRSLGPVSSGLRSLSLARCAGQAPLPSGQGCWKQYRRMGRLQFEALPLVHAAVAFKLPLLPKLLLGAAVQLTHVELGNEPPAVPSGRVCVQTKLPGMTVLDSDLLMA